MDYAPLCERANLLFVDASSKWLKINLFAIGFIIRSAPFTTKTDTLLAMTILEIVQMAIGLV